ncbi:hypothetical protein D3C81_1610260 [compost metagenome]
MGKGAGGQAGDQCVAGSQPGATRVLQAVPCVTCHQFQAMPQRPGRAANAEEMLDIHAVDHHAAEQQHAGRWHLQVLEAWAEVLAVVLDHFQRPAKLGGARGIGVIIRGVRSKGVAKLGVLFQPTQCLVAMFDEGVREGWVVAVADHMFEVGAHGLG